VTQAIAIHYKKLPPTEADGSISMPESSSRPFSLGIKLWVPTIDTEKMPSSCSKLKKYFNFLKTPSFQWIFGQIS
jgi:hypothetical protein